MRKLMIICAIAAPWAAASACSDDDGSDVLPNPPPGSGGTAGTAGGSNAGAGMGGGAGADAGASAGSGGSGGTVGCIPTGVADAGLDAGADAGDLDAGSFAAGSDAGDASASGLVSFAADLHPIFEARCTPCHSTVGYGGHNVAGELEQAYRDAVRLGQTLVDRVNGGGMPPDCEGEPGDPGCLTVEQVALVQSWVNQCFPP